MSESSPAAPAAPSTPAPAEGAQPNAQPGGQQPTVESKSPDFRQSKHKVKINGKEAEVGYEELIASYQTRKASQAAFDEAAQSRKQILEVFKQLKENPKDGLRKLLSSPALGLDARKVATELLAEELEIESMPQSERELRQARKELEQLKAAREAEENAKREQAEQEQRTIHAQRMEQDILGAMKSTPGLPYDAKTYKSFIYYLREGIKRGYDVSPADVAHLVKADYEEGSKSLLSTLDEDALENFLGPDLLEKLAKRRVAKFKGQEAGAAPAPDAPVSLPQAKRPKSDAKPQTFEDIRKKYTRF